LELELERRFGNNVHHCRLRRVDGESVFLRPFADVVIFKLKSVISYVVDEVKDGDVISVLDESSVRAHRVKRCDDSTKKDGTQHTTLWHSTWDVTPLRELRVVENSLASVGQEILDPRDGFKRETQMSESAKDNIVGQLIERLCEVDGEKTHCT
jgi:hypothetical protein